MYPKKYFKSSKTDFLYDILGITIHLIDDVNEKNIYKLKTQFHPKCFIFHFISKGFSSYVET